AIEDASLLANQAVALAVGSFGIFILDGRDRHRLAVITLAPQPAQKGTLQELGIEPVGLGAPVFPRHRNARCMNDVGLDATRSEPPRQPEAISAGLEGTVIRLM